MAEAAGLVLAAVTLFGSCIKGYRIISSAKSLNRDSAVLSCHLEIEEKRFLLWGRNCGLAQSTCLIPARDLSTIIGVLTEIKLLTQDAKELKKRYEIKIDEDQTTSLEQPKEFLQSSLVLAEVQRNLETRVTLQRRPSWKKATRWLFERDGFAKLVNDLKLLNDGLNALLQESQLSGFRNQFTAMCLESCATNDAGRLATIREATSDSYPEFSRITDQRIYTLEIESFESFSAIASNLITFWDLREFSPPRDALQPKAIAFWKGQPVLVEIRVYDQLSQEESTILERRYSDLSRLLGRKPKPRDFHVLDCLGYCFEPIYRQYCLVFAIPPDISRDDLTYQSLQGLFESSRGEGRIRLPNLVERFELCALLARSMLHFHAAGWLHRNFGSASVLFFGKPKDGSCLSTPIIGGFEFARPGSLTAYSAPFSPSSDEIMYHHPDMLAHRSVRYKRVFDIFSLGITLLEIGFWRPISTFHKSKYDPKQNLERLLKNQLDGDLAHRMGQRFEDAVKLCLSGALSSDDMTEKEQLLMFFQKVVLQIDIKRLTGKDDASLI